MRIASIDRSLQGMYKFMFSSAMLGCPSSEVVDDDTTVADDDDTTVGDDDTTVADDDSTGDDDTTACIDDDGDGYCIEDGDCDDENAEIYPGAAEIECDGIDQDCNGEDLTVLSGNYNLHTADASFVGEYDDALAGRSVSGAGDVNGDGYDDILIGAVDNDDGAPDGGKAYLIYGSAYSLYGEIDLGTADASFVGENQEDNIGMTLSGAGDVNGDSYADILLGSHGTYDAYLFYGPVYGEWDATAADAVFRYLPGGLVSEAGDVNGDGYDDILIGAPSVPSTDEGDGVIAIGKAYLFNGPVYGEIDSSMAEAIFNGINNHDGAGYAVSGAGDVNSDGYADILIGTHGAEEAYVVFGPVSGTIDLSLADASFSGLGIHTPHTGSSVSDAGDVNSDGYADILIGAYDFEAGKTYLMYGPFSGNVTLVPSAVDAMFIGENDEDCAGYSISGVGDVDGDGYDDVLIGAPVNDGGGDNRGQSYLFYGNVCP